MDRYTYETMRWLELHFNPEQRALCGQAYSPYQPIDGISAEGWTPQTFLMASRWARLLFHLRSMGASSFLDVGGAEGFIADLVRRTCGITAVSLDLSTTAGVRAREFLDIPALGGESHRLPFPDGAFDVVYLGEVIEHLAHPMRSLAEAARVAKRAVVVTSEAFVRTERERDEEIASRDEDPYQPHMDRSFLSPDDFRTFFDGWNVLITNQCAYIPEPVPHERSALQTVFEDALTGHDLEHPAHAIFVLADKHGQNTPPDSGIAQDIAACLDRVEPATQPRHTPAVDAAVPEELASRLVCPITHDPLRRQGDRLVGKEHSYHVEHGVPSMVTPLGVDFDTSVTQHLEAVGVQRVQTIVELGERLAYRMPQPAETTTFFLNGASGWRPSETVTLSDKPGGGLLVASEHPDPYLFSPRIDRPIGEVRGVEIELCAWSKEPWEELQLFFWTLHKPLWCEAASIKMPFQTGGKLHRMFLRFPPKAGLYNSHDELLALRLDPTHGPSRVGLVRLTIIGA